MINKIEALSIFFDVSLLERLKFCNNEKKKI